MSDKDSSREAHKLPLDAWHRAYGARMVPFAGYAMPIQYEGIIAEHEWTRNSASLFDVSHMGQIRVTGPDAGAALETLLPCSVSSLEEGQMRYSLLLEEDGGIFDDLMITRGPRDAFLLVVNASMKNDDFAHLHAHLNEAIALDLDDESALLALQGPEAVSVLDEIVPGVGALSFMRYDWFAWGPATLGISRSGYTGEDGFEISVALSHVERLADALVADKRVRPAGLGARDSLRLEAGLPLYGHDLTTETDPVSADLAFALAKSRRASGGYPGHRVIVERLASGAATRRVGLAIEGRLPAREGALVFAGDNQVGIVTSGGFSPTLGHPIAMAYVASEHAEVGTELAIEVRGKRLLARIVPMPFVPHRYVRKGG